MLTFENSVGWAFVYATWMVSPPLESYFTYGRSPAMVISVRAGVHVDSPSCWTEKVGL